MIIDSKLAVLNRNRTIPNFLQLQTNVCLLQPPKVCSLRVVLHLGALKVLKEKYSYFRQKKLDGKALTKDYNE